jgi:predicted nucleotidyltransferase
MLGGPDAGLLPETPNDILAYEYISAMRTAEPLAVLRKGAGYHEGQSESEDQSASALREMLGKGMDISAYVPECTAEAGTETGTMLSEGSEERLFDMVRYAVMSRSSEWIDDCPSGGEGLGNLLRSSCAGAKSLDDLIMSVKSRRYTYTRISRLCMQAVLGITRSSYPYEEPLYLRVLGFSGKGRELLSELRSDSGRSLPVITNINKESGNLSYDARKMLGLDVHSSDIYNLVTGRDTAASSDHVMRPVMK